MNTSEIKVECTKMLVKLRASGSFANSIDACLSLGEPIPIKEFGGTNVFFRVPLLKNLHSFGYIDIETQEEGTRYHLARFSLSDKVSAERTTSMSVSDIEMLARNISGDGVALEAPPSLVYLGTPTKVAWHCRVRYSDRSLNDVFVTPDHAFLAQFDGSKE